MDTTLQNIASQRVREANFYDLVPRPVAEAVNQVILEIWNVTPAMIAGPTKEQQIATARRAKAFIYRAVWAIPSWNGEPPAPWATLAQVGQHCGRYDHSSINYSVHRSIALFAENALYRNDVSEALRRLAELAPKVHRDRILRVRDRVDAQGAPAQEAEHGA